MNSGLKALKDRERIGLRGYGVGKIYCMIGERAKKGNYTRNRASMRAEREEREISDKKFMRIVLFNKVKLYF